jgi:hypothetical protein
MLPPNPSGYQYVLPPGMFKTFCSFAHNGTGAITATGVNVGDAVVMTANVTDHTNTAANFETVITVKDQIQQLSATDLSAKVHVFMVIAQS